MRKIVILATYIGVINRGAETFVIELVKQLRNHFQIEVYSLGVSTEIKDNIIAVDLNMPFWYKFHKLLFDKIKLYNKVCHVLYSPLPTVIEQFYFTRQVHRQFLKGRKDIDVMFPNNGHHGARLSKLLRDDLGIPFIYTGHGGIGNSEMKILDEKPNLYIALNETHYLWALRYSNNVVKISNGVDTVKFTPESLRTENREKVILCVGAFVHLKRQKLLIDAIEKLSGVKLILLGEGEMMGELKIYGELKLKDRFIISSVPYDEVNKYYEIADLFSLATKEEPFGIVYLEALSMNVPIVAPDDDSRREIIGDAGLFCDVENPIEYSETILKALAIDWLDLPRKRAVSKFDWNIIANKYIESINLVIKSNAHSE